MKPFVVTSGEPAGIGPDICLALAACSLPIVVVGDVDLLKARAAQLGLDVNISLYSKSEYKPPQSGCLTVLPVRCKVTPKPGQLNTANAEYVLEMLQVAVKKTCESEFAALITAPIHKGIINESGIPFTGHTEFLAEYCNVERVVMMLVSKAMRVALLTTHIPLRSVSQAITKEKLEKVLKILHDSLRSYYALNSPQIYVAGLNPHAGEGGYIGDEEVKTISPVIQKLNASGYAIQGPLSADTMFIPKNLQAADCFLAMYHDQGLPVLKYSGFSESVNITLGLPIIRTSVDHGTALDIAGSGYADANSLRAAISEAEVIVKNIKKTQKTV